MPNSNLVNLKDELVVQMSGIRGLQIPLWGLFIMAVLAVLYFAKAVFIPIFLAVVFSFVLMIPVNLLEKIRIPPSLGALIVLLATLGGFSILAYYMYDPIKVWVERFPDEIQNIETKIVELRSSFNEVQKTTEEIDQTITDLTGSAVSSPGTQEVVVKSGSRLYTLMDNTQAFIVGFMFFLLLLYFLLAFGELMIKSLMMTWKDRAHRITFLRITQESQYQISYYLLLITLINIGLGIVTALGMWMIGMPTPLLWGVSATLLNYIPYIGPLINMILVTFVGLITFEHVSTAMLPALIILGLNIIEGQVVQPLFVGRMFTINPVFVFISVAFWGWLWGVAGMFMAVPLLMILNSFVIKMRELAEAAEAAKAAAVAAAVEAALAEEAAKDEIKIILN
ncbi:Predicted PurR-regulated permease PerM [Thiothrix eikelboomii]|uniref:Predicted PurR-regulated permease PerM n=1 Tax=Thiothrix eikelboomii TaxID=92487 RepID=A0A1T4W624_9GAMM|nr:AI-2E family transporter [Thiothrix eikelboomii]SKA72485.1 Predicted PurR-regulated permease PerM [Thiothrix eikelboomii]